jgi:outer membrane protein
MRKYHLILLITLITSFKVKAQDKLTLEDCYQLSRANYPAVQKMDLINKSAQFTLENANKRYLPQVSFSGQASYQSQTISFPQALSGISGATLPTISKDQYKIQGDVNQTLFDGGSIHYEKEVTRANAELQKQNVEISLYALKDRINNIFFSILLFDAQLKQNELNRANLQTQAQKTQASYSNGVAFKSNVDELNAEVSGTDMSSIEYAANKTAYLKMLSLLIGKEVTSSQDLVMPLAVMPSGEIQRPELKAYQLQKSVYDAQEKQLKSSYLPQFSAFFQGAYGRPTLNIIENKFGPWYITGLRMNWSLGSLYTLGNQKKVLALNRQSIDADQQTFLLNTKLDITQQDEQVNKYSQLIREDEKSVTLRESVTRSAQAQLANGVITTHEYIQQVNAENAAKENLLMHRIQLLQAQHTRNTKSGN